MAGVTGLEPAASGVTGRRSNQLSYTPGNGPDLAPRAAVMYSSPPMVSSGPGPGIPARYPVRPSGIFAKYEVDTGMVVGGDGLEPPTPSV